MFSTREVIQLVKSPNNFTRGKHMLIGRIINDNGLFDADNVLMMLIMMKGAEHYIG